MPISRSAKKSLRKAQKNRGANNSFKEKIKKIIKEFLAKPSEEGYKTVQSQLDKAVKKNIYHKNKVARLKSEYEDRLDPSKAKVEVKKAAKKGKKKPVKKVTKKM